MPADLRRNDTKINNHLHPWAIWSSHLTKSTYLWTAEGNWSTQRKPTYAWGEPQTGRSLCTTPPCHHRWIRAELLLSASVAKRWPTYRTYLQQYATLVQKYLFKRKWNLFIIIYIHCGSIKKKYWKSGLNAFECQHFYPFLVYWLATLLNCPLSKTVMLTRIKQFIKDELNRLWQIYS